MTSGIILIGKSGVFAGCRIEVNGHSPACIGRAHDCEIRLAGSGACAEVSRHHCLIWADDGRVYVRDLGSTNGTVLNGMQIGRPVVWPLPPAIRSTPCRVYVLHAGDELQVGLAVFEVAAPPAAADPVCGARGAAQPELCGSP